MRQPQQPVTLSLPYQLDAAGQSGCSHQQEVSCLDLGCCGGSGARGYAKAGMVVTGVDIEPQPNYPFRFICQDMLEYLAAYGHTYDFIHASPPCQGYSAHVSSADSRWTPTRGKNEPQLIAPLRELLDRIGKPYCIENVIGARNHMRPTLLLCGTMFGLPIARHRLFECNFDVPQPEHPKCRGVARSYAERHGWDYRDMTVTGKGRKKGCATRWKQILRLDGDLTQHQLAEAIPPAYTEYIGQYAVKAANAAGELQPPPNNPR